MEDVMIREIKRFITDFISNSLLTDFPYSSDEIPDDYDLLLEGALDSLGLMTLISKIEESFNAEIDFEDLDPEEMTIIGPLSQYIEKQINNKT